MALLYLGRSWTKSSYLAETALGVTNNGANVYVWSLVQVHTKLRNQESI